MADGDLQSLKNAAGTDLFRVTSAGAVVSASTVTCTGITSSGAITATSTEHTDGECIVPILTGVKDGGTWTATMSSGGVAGVARTAADAASSWWVHCPIESRTTASRGVKVTGIRVTYEVATATVEDVRCELWKRTQAAVGASTAAVEFAGGANGDYTETAYNTAAKRSSHTTSSGKHTINLTVPTGDQAYLGTKEAVYLRFYVDGDAGAAGVVTLTSAQLIYTHTAVGGA